jgi:hypothetical protein
VAEQLAREHIIDRIHPSKQAMMIQFGIQSARLRLIDEIYGAGLINVLYVVSDELPSVLIGDITFTPKGVALVQDDVVLIGVAGDRVGLCRGVTRRLYGGWICASYFVRESGRGTMKNSS